MELIALFFLITMYYKALPKNEDEVNHRGIKKKKKVGDI